MNGPWEKELGWLAAKGARLAPGLSDGGLRAAEEACGASFPPDLASLLRAALPLGDRFPDWRSPGSAEIKKMLAWPFEGLCFDIEHNAYWPKEWGARPPALEDAFKAARQKVEAAPKLIPLYSHRYLPAAPREAGNPVFSVYQTDVIYYGRDLRSYLACEFGDRPWEAATSGSLKRIPFWTDLVESNR
ncbi:SMI1/KNR4 family protein [bacterium]|nr:MAG: SMI1/KNR4 family protein [bacterium]